MAASALQEHTGAHLRAARTGEANSPGQAGPTRLQQTVWSIGSLAKDSRMAYSLAVLFAISTPFGFATPEQAAAEAAAKLQQQQQAAQAAQAATSRGSSSLTARLVANARAQRVRQATAASTLRAVPPFWQLAGFAAVFATGGYIIDQGDSLNGSGVVSAWSITYILFRTLPTLKLLPKSPLALALSTSVATIGLGVHGCHYFDVTSWKGAVPGMSQELSDESAASVKQRQASGSFSAGSASRQGKLLSGWKQTAVEGSQRAQQQVGSTTGIHTISETPTLLRPAPLRPPRNNDEARAAAYLSRDGAT